MSCEKSWSLSDASYETDVDATTRLELGHVRRLFVGPEHSDGTVSSGVPVALKARHEDAEEAKDTHDLDPIKNTERCIAD